MGRLMCLLTQSLFFLLQFHVVFPSSSPPLSSSAHHLCPHDQSLALLQFKHVFTVNSSASDGCEDEFTGVNFSYPKTMSWNRTGTDCCTWDGVKCEGSTGHVIGLDLSCSQLQGTIPSNITLFQLVHLQSLNLAYNDFSLSPISHEFGNFASLTHLNLSSSRFSGQIPSEISYLSKLVSLHLSDNSITFEHHNFKMFFQNLTQLRELVLFGIDISSTVPMNLSSSLTSLQLAESGLHGKVPDYIFHLPNLKELGMSGNYNLIGKFPNVNWSSSSLNFLDLSDTSFFGELPDSIGNPKFLNVLALSGCKFSGSIPESIGNLTQITVLDLRGNNFSGKLPDSIGFLRSLNYLQLSSNKFNGTIPSTLSYLEQLNELDLSHNNLEGQFPDVFANLKKLQGLGIENNALTGTIPQSISKLVNLVFLNLQFNLFQGPLLVPPFNVIDFSVSHNILNGEIPSSICNLSSLVILGLSNNHFSGVIPQCLGNFSNHLSILDLQMNDFHGTIPMTFAEGNTLRNLDLSGNQLEGKVPQSLANCRYLEILDLRNNKINDTFPHWLETLPQLQLLFLQSNRFHGPITASKTKSPFPKLRIIHLSHNEFTGLLPSKYFENFVAIGDDNYPKYIGDDDYPEYVTMMIKGLELEFELMQFKYVFASIDLSSNKFTGEIPNFIGNLKYLRGLNLSHNSLTGHIPSSLGNLTMLESLDLSSNQLVGEIPEQLTSLTFLEFLNLSQNHLMGRIPEGKQFNTFQNDSYSGNLALCGFPLSKNCGDSKTPQQPSVFEQEDDSDFTSGLTWKVVLIGYGCGMLFGLAMGYLMFLTGKPKWIMERVEIKSKRSGQRRNGISFF